MNIYTFQINQKRRKIGDINLFLDTEAYSSLRFLIYYRAIVTFSFQFLRYAVTSAHFDSEQPLDFQSKQCPNIFEYTFSYMHHENYFFGAHIRNVSCHFGAY